MAEVTVPQSAANCAKGSALYELAVLVNANAAAINVITGMLDDDTVGAADYVATVGTMDTITFNETGTPA